MINYHLDCLDSSDTEDYILTGLKVAGLGTTLFTNEAIKEIFQFIGGIPRRINNPCEKCLLVGYIQEKKLIDDILMKRVIKSEFE